MKKIAAALLFLIAGCCYAQTSIGGGGDSGGGGGTGFPITIGSTPIAASSSNPSLAGLTSVSTVGTLDNVSGYTAIPSCTATALANCASQSYFAEGSYWNGTAASNDFWWWDDSLGTGSNPAATLLFHHTGSSGSQAVSIPYPLSSTTLTATSHAADSGNCAQFGTGGIINSSGAPCGSGGGGFPAGSGIPTVETGSAWGPTIPEVPAEAFGAVGNASCSAATDSTTALQNAINSLSSTGGLVRLQPLCYKISSALSITHSNVGIVGFNTIISSPSNFSDYPASIIYQTSASADIIDVDGSGSGHISGNQVKHLTLRRAVTPTGTAAGLSLNFTYAAVVDQVNSADSIRGFYIHASASLASGIFNSAAQFGYNGVSETTGSIYGFYLDSADGVASPSMFYSNPAVFNVSAATSYGFYVNGAAINDIDVTNLNTATTDWGIYINYTGGGGIGTASDLHFWNSTIDSMKTGCIFVNGIPSSAYGSVEFTGGWCGGPATITNVVDIEGSSGVTVQNMQISDAAATSDVLINGGSGNTISGDNFVHVTSNGVKLNNTTLNNIVGNSLIGFSATTGALLDNASTYNAIAKNVFGGSIATGIATNDSGSNGNSGFMDNVFGPSVPNSYDDQTHGNSNYTFNGNSGDNLILGINNNTNSSGSSAGFKVGVGNNFSVATAFYTVGSARTPSGLVQPLSTYFASANGLTNGIVFNTETSAPLKFATNNTLALTLDGTTQVATFAQPFGLPNGSTATTQTTGDNTTKVATDAFVKSQFVANGTPTFTPGTGVTSTVCASGYTCTNTRGEITLVGGTATTGTIATVNFSATLGTAPFCSVGVNGNGGSSTTFFDLGHGTPSTSSFTITAGVTVIGATINIDYSCQP